MIINQMLARSDHAIWVFIQQVIVRGLIATKFLLAARILGPEQIGLVGIATLSLTIAESLTDTGMSQAVIQRYTKISSSEAGAVWTLQVCRGILLAFALMLLATPIAALFKISDSIHLLELAAIIPLLRNAFNPGIFVVQRDRNFRHLSIYEISAASLDIFTTLALVKFGLGAPSILIGNIASDCLKLIISWTWLRLPLMPTLKWHLIGDFTSFGKWIWGASVTTLLINQLDKVLVAKILGTTEFGLYQVASRIAQLVVADGAIAMGQYLFPTFATRHRSDIGGSRNYLSWIMRRLLPGAGLVALLLIFAAGPIVNLVLSSEWSEAAPVLRVLAISSFFGAIIAVFVAYLRGTGRPNIVTAATLVQLIILILVTPPLLHYFAAVGMAYSVVLAGAASMAYMYKNISSN